MQRLLWPLRARRLEQADLDGYSVYAVSPGPSGGMRPTEIQAVLARRRRSNGKREWNVYTRYLVRDDDGNEWWEYHDGLEFRHLESQANEEFSRRSDELRKSHE